MENQTKIIEVNGVKMEIDMRHVKVIDNYKVGDNIKVLVKEYDSYKSYIGQIIGFDEFEKSPTIVIAYLKTSYGSAQIEFLYYNQHTKDAEITTLNDWDVPATKSQIIAQFKSEQTKKEQELNELKNKEQIFERLFGKYFEQSIGASLPESF